MSIVKFSEVAHRAYTREDRFNTEKIYYVGGEHIDSCELYVTKKGVIKGSTIGPMFYCGFTAGQILFVTRNPHLKKCSIADFDGICSEKTFVIETKDESILTQEYLAIIMQSDDFWNYCEENKSGGVNYFLNWSTLADYEFELPPIKQQLEIAQKVMSAYRLKQSYKKLLDATREMVKSQFIEMFKGDNQVPLGDICNIEKGATITRNDVLPGEVPVVAGGQEPSCYHNVANREAGAITVSASGAYAGYINFWNCPIFASDCNTIISKDDEKTDQTFVYFGLRVMQKQIYGLQKGGAQPHVYGKDLQKFMFPCPSYAKQIEFSKMAKQADKSEFVGCKSQFIEMFSGAPKVGINNLVDTVWGSSPDSKTYNDIGEGMPFYQGKTEFGDLYINAPVTYCTAPIKMAKANAILMSVRAPVGAVNIATQDCCIGRGLASITPKEGKSTTMFVYYALKYMEADIDRLGTGSTFKAINKESYAKIQMPNAKISEQAKFVSIAEQADKSEFVGCKSQFIEMFGTVESYCKLEDLVSDTFPGEWGSEPTSENAIKVIRTTNFTNEGHLDLADVVTRDIEPKKVARKKLKQGDTILERSGGTKDNPVGRVVFFDEIGDYLLNNFTQALRPKESVNPVYLFYALYNSYNINKAAMRAMASQTTGIQNLSMSDFMSKSIVLPSRDEQNKFEQIYRQADKSEYYN